MKANCLMCLIVILLLSCGDRKYYHKPAAIIGKKEGSIHDVHLLMYPDSTFFYSNTDKNYVGDWRQKGDTITLYYQDSIQAVLVDLNPTEIYNPSFNWLHGMDFIHRFPPQIVKFPSD